MLKIGDKVGLISCSDGVRIEDSIHIENLITILKRFGVESILSKTLYRSNSRFSGEAQERAKELMNMFECNKI